PAVPMEAKVAVKIIINCSANDRSYPKNCAMNMTATPWYNAVPSILMVDPSGRTKLLTFLGTPRFSSVLLMVTGSVPELLVVLKATKLAGAIPLKNFSGFIFAKYLTEAE